MAFSHCEYFLPGRWNSTDLVNRSLYCCLPPFYLKSHLFASYERPSCAHSTLVYLYGGSIEMSVNRRCLLFTIILKSVSSSVDLQQPFLSSSSRTICNSLSLPFSFTLVRSHIPSLRNPQLGKWKHSHLHGHGEEVSESVLSRTSARIRCCQE